MTNAELIEELQKRPPAEEVKIFDGFRSRSVKDVLDGGIPRTNAERWQSDYDVPIKRVTFIRTNDK
jgi:hypothetical protein